MSAWHDLAVYGGEGKPLRERNQALPEFDDRRWHQLHDPSAYEADPGLRDAVNVSLLLGLPLLLTGEPGTGKTELAWSIAWELSATPEAWESGRTQPLVFRTRSNSSYTDLFYRYDALRHYQDIHIRKQDNPVETYIDYGPLGQAILRAADRDDIVLPKEYRGAPQQRSVVLIDEIDKAPRDLPNDVLNELDTMSFEVRELKHTFRASQRFRPILILTSNLERDLPEPFRRRCAFFHIEFPDKTESDRVRLISIIRKRVPKVAGFTPEMLSNAVAMFMNARALPLEKKPSMAELLSWTDLLQRCALDVRDGKSLKPSEQDLLASSFSLLAKSDDDMRKLRAAFVSIAAASS